MHAFWKLHEMWSWQTFNASGGAVHWVRTDHQWPSHSPTELVETVLVQVPNPTPDMLAMVDSSFEMLPKGSSCWEN